MTGEPFVLERLDILHRLIGARQPNGPRPGVSPPTGSRETIPLTHAQRRWWALGGQSAGRDNDCTLWRLDGVLDPSVMKRCLGELVARQEALRTAFVTEEGRTVQVVRAPVPIDLRVADLSALPEADRAAELSSRIEAEARPPFEFSRAPLVRAVLFRLSDAEHRLLLTMPRVIADRWSHTVFVRELALLYDAFAHRLTSPLPDLPVSYADYIAWEGRVLEDEEFRARLRHWTQRLGSGLPRLSLPTDRPYAAVPNYRAASRSLDLGDALDSVTHALGGRIEPGLILLAAFKALLSRYAGEEVVTVGCRVPGRELQGSECLIGPFAKMIALRTDLAGDPPFRELLERVREAVAEASAYPRVPVERVLEELEPERLSRPEPLFQAILSIAGRSPTCRLPDLTIEPVPIDEPAPGCDLELELSGAGDAGGRIRYRTGLFEPGTIARMAAHLRVLLEAVAANPDERVSHLPVLTESERRRLLFEWDGRKNDVAENRTIHQFFEAQAAARPGAPAIAFPERDVSYGDLNARANRVAHALLRRGLEPSERVAILLQDGPRQVEALFGTLKAGGAFVGLDPRYPGRRLKMILEEAEPSLLITDDHGRASHQRLVQELDGLPRGVLLVDGEAPSDEPAAASGADFLERCPTSNPDPRVGPADPAYLVYTSGSTGKPKGIVQSHRSFCQFIGWQAREFGIGPGQRFAQWASIAYDASYCEIFGALCFGATLNMTTEDVRYDPLALLDWARREKVTILQLVPSFCRQVVEALEREARRDGGVELPDLESLLLAGEVLPVDLAAKWLALFPTKKLYNLYGPSESVLATYYRVEEVQPGQRSVPIGRAIDGRQILILDSRQQLCPIGVPGEIYIRSRYLTSGYHALPEQTAERYLQNPLHEHYHDPVYRTGDIGRWRADGVLEFHGRRDNLVKLRGNRVELGDIESVLRQYEGIRDGAVVVRTIRRGRPKLVAKDRRHLTDLDDGGEQQLLVAYFTADGPASKSELRRFHEERLPPHMVPQRYVQLAELPRNANQKLDHRALPEPESERPELDVPYIAPRDPTEAALIEIFEEVLGIDGIGVNDSFFELGGDSLLAMQVLNRAGQKVGLALSFRDLFEQQTVAELAEGARPEGGPAPTPPSLESSPRDIYPLSLAQEGVWFLWKLEPESPYYTGQGTISLRGPLDIVSLQRAWRALLARHVVLRARFTMENGRPEQRFEPRPGRDLPIIDLTDLPEGQRRPAMEERVRKKAQRAFDLENDILLQAELFRLSQHEHEIALTFHEIILDLWALSILIQDLGRLYAGFRKGDASPLPEPEVSFGDYVVWEREHVRRSALTSQEEYWTRELSGELQVLELPRDRPRPPAPSFRGESRAVMLEPGLTAELRSLSASENATLFMTLLAATKILLRLYSGQDDIIVGAPIANRTHPHAESLVGFFLNMLPLRTRFDGDPTFRELLRKVRETVTGAITHGEYPFAWMLETVDVPRDRTVSPVFQVMFNMLNLPQLSLTEADLEIDFSELETGYTKYDLSFYAQEHGDQVFLEIAYQTDLFDDATIERMLANLTVLLESIVARPESRISTLQKISDAERQILLHEFNATDRDFGNELCLQQLFERQVERTPDATAYMFEGRHLTYAELDQRANRLGHYLRGLGVDRETPVAVCTRRSFDLVVALMGVMKAGGAYVALDPEYPLLRLYDILEDVQPPLLLLQSDVDRFESFEGRKVYIDREWPRIEEESAEPPAAVGRTQDLLNIVYTSSTTGQPKGVLISQEAVLNRLFWMWEDYPFRAGDVAVLQKSYALVAATWELFGGLLRGVPTLVLSEEDLLDPGRLWEQLVTHRVTHLLATPAFYQRLLDQAESHPGEWTALRLATTSAEPIAPAMVYRWRRAFPNVPLLNLYGATECASNVTVYDTRDLPDDAPRVPIGVPLPNTSVYVLDEHLQPIPIGVTGEMCVAGACLARGYLHLPELTAERFVPNPFSDDSLLYRTGDLARVRPDRDVELLGRADDQVNIRGFRVELADVEAGLIRHENVVRCSVRLYEGDGRRRLVAYVVPADPVSTSSLRRHLQDRLPEYMIPSDYVFLEALPLTPSGKVDRKALPPPEDARPDLEVVFRPPRTPTEESIARVWAEVLGVEKVGIDDNFFELGGHSLLATQVAERLRGLFGLEVPLVSLFRSPTVAGLAAELTERMGDRVPVTDLPQIDPNPTEKHLPFPLTDVQEAYWIGRSGSFELGNIATHFYAEVESQDLELERFQAAWQRLVERHDMLRATMLPDGRQRILENVPPYVIEVLDLRDREASAVEAELAAVRDRMSHQVLQSDEWPLFEIRASRLEEKRFRLHFSFDALICDAFSKRLLFQEWLTLYRDPEAVLPPLDLSFRDYVLAQEELEGSDVYQRALEYWMDRLESLPPAPELPLAKDPSSIRQPRFVTRTATLEPRVWDRLKQRGTRAGLTPSGLTLACFAEVLKRWSKSPRLTINMTLFNRLPLHPQVNDVVGDFTSLNLLEVDNSDRDTFVKRARRLQEQLWDDLDHRYVSGVRVLRERIRRQGGAPRAAMPVVFTSVLTHDSASDDHPMFWMGEVVHASYQTPQVWLDHSVVEEAGALQLNWTALEELFPEGLVQDMLDAYCRLLRRLAEDERSWQTGWNEIARELLPPEQAARRATVNSTEAPVSQELLHTLFAAQARRRPDRPAVVTSGRTLTYDELHRHANRVARRLRRSGVRPNTLVAVVMEKGWEQVVAALGVLAAGAAYVPIDAGLPRERRSYLLEHARVDLVLTQSDLDRTLPWPEDVRRISVDGAELADLDDAPLEPIQTPDDLAYVIYTSGSTGLPKGVMIDHRGAVNTILDVNRRFGVTERDRVLALSSLSFDLSVYDIFGLLAAGGTIVIPDPSGTRDPAHWAELVAREKVTIWNTVPPLMKLLVEYVTARDDSPCGSLRLVLLSGDWIPTPLPDQVRPLCDEGVEVISLGGATEASIWSISYPIGEVDPAWPSIPYGRPMTNQRFHVLDDALQPCPVWVPGQLYIGGIGLAKGYWRDEEKTRTSFFNHPRTGERLYRTGDLGRFLPDGNIEFLGREDFQVKVQGHRIELGEIEAALLDHPAVGSTVVSTVGERRGEKRLVAYVVAREGPAPESDELRAFLLEKLPEYMVPAAYVHLPELPLTPNGKVDRQALPTPSASRTERGTREGRTPTELETRIADLVAGLLELERAGPDENLLSLGATSIEMIRIANRLELELGFRPPMDAFYRDPTVTGLIRLYEEAGGASPASGRADGVGEAALTSPGVRSFEPIRDPEQRKAFKLEQWGLRRGREPSVPLVASTSLDDLRERYTARRSVRRFSPKPVRFRKFSEFLGCLRQIELDGKPKYLYGSAGGLYPVQTYVYVKPDRVEGLPAGVYYYHPRDHRLWVLSRNGSIDGDVYGATVNRPVFDEAAFAIYLIAQLRAIGPIYGEYSQHFATIEAGLMAQLLETSAPASDIGLCQIGSLEFEAIRHLFALDEDHELVHSLLGGRLDRSRVEDVAHQRTEREEGEI